MKYALITLFALTLTACSFTRETSKVSETKTETETQRLRTTFSDLSEFITITLPELPPQQPAPDGNDIDVTTKPETKAETKHEATKPEPAPPVFAGLPAGTRIEIRRKERTRETEQEETATREETREESEEKVERNWFNGFSLFWAVLSAAVVAIIVILTLLRRF